MLGNFFKSIDKFIELFSLSKKENLLKNIAELDGIGSAQLKSLNEFFSNKINNEMILSLIKYLKIENSKVLNKNGKLSGKTIMFTGGFEKISRSEAKSLVEENGGKVLDKQPCGCFCCVSWFPVYVTFAAFDVVFSDVQ